MAKKATAEVTPIPAPTSGMDPSAPGTTAPATNAAPAAVRTRTVKPKIYMVLDEINKIELPVKALTRSRAISYCAEATFKARLAGTDDLIKLGASGAEIHDATKETD